eukprot:14850777-Alexandrium_andersonii.AAC.1
MEGMQRRDRRNERDQDGGPEAWHASAHAHESAALAGNVFYTVAFRKGPVSYTHLRAHETSAHL